ncbi:hypothetical protein ACFE04_021157 [Oxalis oulophora]
MSQVKKKTRTLDTQNLLQQLPVLQGLLSRLLACKPLGAAAVNALIHYPLSIVAGESIRLYVAIVDGILNLVDKYFEMQRDDAIRALDLYRKSAKQAEELSWRFGGRGGCVGGRDSGGIGGLVVKASGHGDGGMGGHDSGVGGRDSGGVGGLAVKAGGCELIISQSRRFGRDTTVLVVIGMMYHWVVIVFIKYFFFGLVL